MTPFHLRAFNYDEIESGDDVYCACCEQVRTAKVIDCGYGPTEYWGSWSNHVDLRTVCNYCESEDISVPEEEMEGEE